MLLAPAATGSPPPAGESSPRLTGALWYGPRRMPAHPSIVIAAGGTGGHIFPGLALARELRSIDPEARITFIGTPRGLEGRLIPEAGFALELVDMVPFTGRSRAVFPVALVRSAFQANRVLRQVSADVAVSMGGYPGIPAVSGAWLGRLPSLIHESGAIPGRANLLAARLTRNVGVAFESAVASFSRSDVRVVGMPLDAEVAALDRSAERDRARSALGLDRDSFVVFITGGSQGAASLNAAAVDLGRRWAGRDGFKILLKTGRAHHDEMVERIEAAGAAEVVIPVAFFDRMTDPYAAADLTVSRAGASSVAEIAAIGVPSILVPYPHASDDHQTVNARALSDTGGAELVPDGEATGDRLGPLIEDLAARPDRLAALAEAARRVGRPGAARELAEWVLDLAGVKG